MKIRGIHYHVNVRSEGEPLVLLHGFTGPSLNWNNIIDDLAAYKVILIDIIGHGQTESPNDASRYKMEEVVEDLVHILDQLQIDRANFLGYSMGGRLALSFASIYPHRVKRLILESSSPGLKTEGERESRKQADERLAGTIKQEGIEKFVDKWERIPLFASQSRLPIQQQNKIRQQRLQNSPNGLANSLMGMGTGAQPSWWDRLPELNMPVLILCGQLDKKFCEIAKRMHRLLPKSVIKEVNGAGHAIHVEEPRIFGKIVSEFINLNSD